MAELELRDQEIRVLAESKQEVKRRKKELKAQMKYAFEKYDSEIKALHE